MNVSEQFKYELTCLINSHRVETGRDNSDADLSEFLSVILDGLGRLNKKRSIPKVTPIAHEWFRFLHPVVQRHEDQDWWDTDRAFMYYAPPTDTRRLYPVSAYFHSDNEFSWVQWNCPITEPKELDEIEQQIDAQTFRDNEILCRERYPKE